MFEKKMSKDFDYELENNVYIKEQQKTQKPKLYKVLLLNDDFTTQEFVTYVLEHFFNKSSEQAFEIMLHVHKKGVGVCGVYSFEVAEMKVSQVMLLAESEEFPLQCIMESE
ncbi:MAG: ATP-dependent Clp protease adapter ClpS [Rhizobiales bacterium]|nr:ATP-dependent Clp protease adapter ClpS [Hyphomicrobiales bacterium]